MRLVLWTVLAALAELAGRAGQTGEALELRRALGALLAQLAERGGGPERRAGFLGTPGVRAALKLVEARP